MTTTGAGAGDVAIPEFDDHDLRPGDHFAGLRIERRIGSGGMGEVYEATDASGRRVALKRIRRDRISAELRDRFCREARIAGSLLHPHCVLVHTALLSGSTPFLVMDLVPGPDLHTLVEERGPLPLSDALEFGLDILAGLEAIHHQHLLHRDLKPANCLLDADGRVRISDFGLSKDTLAATTPSIVGTLGFAAPEQVAGRRIDRRSDVWSAAATIHYLLFGTVPVYGQDLATDVSVADRLLRRGMRRRTLDAIAKGLSLRPDDRWPTATAFRNALLEARDRSPMRFVAVRTTAYVIDAFCIFLAVVPPVTLTVTARHRSITSKELLTLMERSEWYLPRFGWLLLVYVGYFLVHDRSGQTPGKALTGLRRVSVRAWADRASIRLLRSSVRASHLMIVFAATLLAHVAGHPLPLSTIAPFVLLLLLGSWIYCWFDDRGIHGRLTASRVVRDRSEGTTVVRAAVVEEAEPPADAERIGPYRIVRDLAPSPLGTLHVAHDPELRRRLRIGIWHTPPFGEARRGLRHPAALPWLDGSTEGRPWDAFLWPDAVPLTVAAVESGRSVLACAARTLAAPPVACYAIGQVEVASDRDAVFVVDAELCGVTARDESAVKQAFVDLCEAVGDRLEQAGQRPYCLTPAALRRHADSDPREAFRSLAAALAPRPEWRPRRKAVAFLHAALAAFLVWGTVHSVVFHQDLKSHALAALAANAAAPVNGSATDPARRQRALWRPWFVAFDLGDCAEKRAWIDRIVRTPRPGEGTTVPPALWHSQLVASAREQPPPAVWYFLLLAPVVLLLLNAWSRGPVLSRLAGRVLVGPDGQRASPLRAASRFALRWSPIWVLFSASWMTTRTPDAITAGYALFLAGWVAVVVVLADALLTRGAPRAQRIVDRLLGTRLVDA